jgi:hypothetical protein
MAAFLNGFVRRSLGRDHFRADLRIFMKKDGREGNGRYRIAFFAILSLRRHKEPPAEQMKFPGLKAR